ncbi:MAG: hypothetical protein KGH79_02340 [Patescibacteria group bacterium]|nr:hypothetical protein [Patescibacteria group bacterium]
MNQLLRIGISAALAIVFLAPLQTFAFLPIGGKIIAVHPCPPLVPGYAIDVVGFGIGTGIFWYVPGVTLTYLYGPPFVGEWILGLAAPLGACGPATTMTGTSPV